MRRFLVETYTTEPDLKCDICGNVDICFQHYELDQEGMPQIARTECGFCDELTDPRGAQDPKDLKNPKMWRENQ